MTDLPLPDPALRPAPGQLTFTAPRRGKPPTHLADLTPPERKAAVEALGHKGFRAKQLSTHYFDRLVEDPAEMTDLPAAVRSELVGSLLPPLMTPVRALRADGGASVNDTLMQLQADLADVQVERSLVADVSAIGAAHLAGLVADVWDDAALLAGRDAGRSSFGPRLDPEGAHRTAAELARRRRPHPVPPEPLTSPCSSL